MKRSAEISACGKYRYALRRLWDTQLPTVLFIGLNPSTADASLDDPTLRRCIKFAETWGYGGVVIGNLFAFRAKDPRALRNAPDPIGPANDQRLVQLRQEAGMAVAAWGHLGTLNGRGSIVAAMLSNLYCLGQTKTGAPRHPLYVRGSAELQEWAGYNRYPRDLRGSLLRG